MQHHGFEVATPSLLRAGSEALTLPTAALQETCSLNGTTVFATLTERSEESRVRLSQLAASLVRTSSAWPRHPWEAHRLIAMFELLPSLYLQAKGAVTPKWRSFDEARYDFGDSWWPYDVLRDVRQIWPRLRRRSLERAAYAVRNPWVAVAVWRRAPVRLPAAVDELLTDGLLHDLRSLATTMRDGVS
jgi:hypothetical protein